jgi:hypothetical protein
MVVFQLKNNPNKSKFVPEKELGQSGRMIYAERNFKLKNNLFRR